eukprot:6220274-Amphidinium_carterae.1
MQVQAAQTVYLTRNLPIFGGAHQPQLLLVTPNHYDYRRLQRVMAKLKLDDVVDAVAVQSSAENLTGIKFYESMIVTGLYLFTTWH